MGTQAFFKTIPGVVMTEAGRANGTTNHLEEPYDGYAECVKVEFNPQQVTIKDLMGYLFEIIDPYSLNRQGPDIEKSIELDYIVRINRISTKHKHLSMIETMRTVLW